MVQYKVSRSGRMFRTMTKLRRRPTPTARELLQRAMPRLSRAFCLDGSTCKSSLEHSSHKPLRRIWSQDQPVFRHVFRRDGRYYKYVQGRAGRHRVLPRGLKVSNSREYFLSERRTSGATRHETRPSTPLPIGGRTAGVRTTFTNSCERSSRSRVRQPCLGAETPSPTGWKEGEPLIFRP